MIALGACAASIVVMASQIGWANLWSAPDQRGRWLFEHTHFAEAAEAFTDPMWRGVALARAGDFKESAAQFDAVDTAEAAYDAGNALVMLGKYEDALARYDRALVLRPGWTEAKANRAIAQVRADRLKTTGGDMTGGQTKPDEVVFDKGKKPGPDAGKEAGKGSGEMSDEAIRALWLKRVHIGPADFLRAKFSFQLQQPSVSSSPASRP